MTTYNTISRGGKWRQHDNSDSDPSDSDPDSDPEDFRLLITRGMELPPAPSQP